MIHAILTNEEHLTRRKKNLFILYCIKIVFCQHSHRTNIHTTLLDKIALQFFKLHKYNKHINSVCSAKQTCSNTVHDRYIEKQKEPRTSFSVKKQHNTPPCLQPICLPEARCNKLKSQIAQQSVCINQQQMDNFTAYRRVMEQLIS